MKARLKQLHDAYMARNRRERWLLAVVLWALTAWAGLALYEQTLAATGQQLQAQQQQLERQINEQQGLEQEFNQRISELKANDQRARVARLSRQLNQINANVDARMRTLVGPEQMPALLLSVLDQQTGLTLTGLTNLPAEPINPAQEGGDILYRHALALELSGSYLQLLDYAKQLESLSGRIFWQSLSFELQQHPTGLIRLEFFTISQHKELIRG